MRVDTEVSGSAPRARRSQHGSRNQRGNLRSLIFLRETRVPPSFRSSSRSLLSSKVSGVLNSAAQRDQCRIPVQRYPTIPVAPPMTRRFWPAVGTLIDAQEATLLVAVIAHEWSPCSNLPERRGIGSFGPIAERRA